MLSRPESRFRSVVTGVLLAGWLCLASACDHAATEPEVAASPADGGLELAVASNSWITRAALPGIERIALTSAVVPNAAGERILYAIGGASTAPGEGGVAVVQAYNPATNAWTARAPLPTAVYLTNGAVTIGGKIYVSGGRTSGDKNYEQALFVYDPAANACTRKHDMPTETWGGVSGAIGGKLYVLTCDNEDLCDRFERMALCRYDPATDQWTSLGYTPIPLGEPLGGVIGGKLYATGGPEGRLLVYDPATNGWTEKAKLAKHRQDGAAAVVGGKLYVIGGYEVGPPPEFGFAQVRKTTVYDPKTNAWTSRAPIPTWRRNVSATRITVNGVERLDLVGGDRPGNHLQYIP